MKKEVNTDTDADMRILTIPNIITTGRLISIISILYSCSCGNFILAGGIFAIASLSDALDGIIARKCNQSSLFGAKLDAFTDKAFLISTIPMVILNPIMLINLVIEGLIALVNSISYIKGNKTKTKQIGRVKTCFLFALLTSGFFAINNPSVNIIKNILIILTATIQGTSLKVYHDEYKKLETAKKRKKDNLQTSLVAIDKDNKKFDIYIEPNNKVYNNNLENEQLNYNEKEKVKIKKLSK